MIDALIDVPAAPYRRGGECSYWGCIPSKTLLRQGEAVQGGGDAGATAEVDVEAALAWRDYRVDRTTSAVRRR